jgi:hypothetical protein
LAQSRDLLQVENIVVIENSSRQVAGTSGEKEQVIGDNPRPRSFLPLDYRRGGAPRPLPFAEHAERHDDAAIRATAVMKIFDNQIARFFAVPAMRRNDFSRRNFGGKGLEEAIASLL